MLADRRIWVSCNPQPSRRRPSRHGRTRAPPSEGANRTGCGGSPSPARDLGEEAKPRGRFPELGWGFTSLRRGVWKEALGLSHVRAGTGSRSAPPHLCGCGRGEPHSPHPARARDGMHPAGADPLGEGGKGQGLGTVPFRSSGGKVDEAPRPRAQSNTHHEKEPCARHPSPGNSGCEESAARAVPSLSLPHVRLDRPLGCW